MLQGSFVGGCQSVNLWQIRNSLLEKDEETDRARLLGQVIGAAAHGARFGGSDAEKCLANRVVRGLTGEEFVGGMGLGMLAVASCGAVGVAIDREEAGAGGRLCRMLAGKERLVAVVALKSQALGEVGVLIIDLRIVVYLVVAPG